MGNAEHRTQNAECKTQNEKNFDVLSSEFDVLSSCRLCPRACGADRLAGQLGYCRAGVLPRVFRYGAHFGEEPPQIIPIRDLKNLDTYTKHFLLKTPELPSTVDRMRTSNSEHRTQNAECKTQNAERRT